MNKIEESKRTMCLVVKDEIQITPASVIDGMPMFDQAFQSFNNLLGSLTQQSEKQLVNRKGHTTLKNDFKAEMVASATSMSIRIKAFAVNTNDDVLAEEMSKSYYDILKKRDTITSDLCLYIHSKAVEFLTELGAYGVTPLVLEELLGTIESFNQQLPKPRIGIVKRREATRNIKAIFKLIDAQLKIMDGLVDMYRYSNEEFYNSYYAARMIVDAGHRTVSIQGLVVDMQGMPLQKVEMSIVGTNITRKTSEFGGFEIKNLESKVYQLRLTKAGYEDTVVEVPVTATERTMVNVQMKVDTNQALRVA